MVTARFLVSCLVTLLFCSLSGGTFAQDFPTTSDVEVVGTKPTPREIPTDCHDYKLLQDIEDARIKWRSLGISDYSYAVERHAFARLVGWPPNSPLVITVRNGIASIVPKELPDSVIRSLTVEGQFEALEKAVLEAPDCLRATFDETFGFTNSTYLDPDWDTTDDEVSLKFTDFGA